MYTITLAENLKSLRKQHSYTQKDISSYLHVSRQCYSQYESGQRSPNYSTLIQLTSLYGVSLDYLFFHSNNSSFVHPQCSQLSSKTNLTLQEPEPLYITMSEITLIKIFRKTPLSIQKKVLRFLEYKSSQSTPDNKNNK